MNRKDYNRQMMDFFIFDNDAIYAEAQRRIKECRKTKGKKLDFSALDLKELPPEIAELETLTELDIRIHEIKKVPAFIGKLVNLRKLLVGSPHSSTHEREAIILPPELGNLRNLRYLSLGYGIPEIPQWVWGLENLDTLIVFNDAIETIPAEIASLKKLCKLRLLGQNIAKLPGEIGEQLPLTALDLECPKLVALPESFANLKTMQGFRFTRSNLSAIPHYMCGWTNLKELVLSMDDTFQGPFTVLKGIPKNVGNLKKLRILKLSGASITTIPVSLGNCPLEHLELSGDFKIIPESFGNFVNLKTLKLSSDKPLILPNSFGNLRSLKELLIRAPVLGIPASFGKLAALEDLSLVCKEDLVLPKTFGGLCALKELWIDALYMRTIPASIGNCKNLKLVKLGSDKLTSLPESFCGLKNLEELHLETFALKALPVKFGSLAALKSLTFFSGAITTLPKSMIRFKKLKSLWLDAYNIKKLPDWFQKLPAIKEKSIQIGKEEDALSRHSAKKKRGIPSFNELTAMGHNYRWKLLDSYSLKEIESIICSAPEIWNVSADEKYVFKDIMLDRRRRLNGKFKWTEENKRRIAKVSDEFLKVWEEGFTKAKAIIAALHGKEQNKDKVSLQKKYQVEIILHPEITCSKKDGKNNKLYNTITIYLNSEIELSMNLRCDPAVENKDQFIKSIHVSRDLSWNIEGFGDIELKDHYICYALHILYSHNEWAFEDIAKINSISTEIRVNDEGGTF